MKAVAGVSREGSKGVTEKWISGIIGRVLSQKSFYFSASWDRNVLFVPIADHVS